MPADKQTPGDAGIICWDQNRGWHRLNGEADLWTSLHFGGTSIFWLQETWRPLEAVGVADGHAGRGIDWFGWYELGRVAVEVVDAIDEGGAMDGFGCVCERGSGGPLLEEIVEVRT